MILPAPTWFGLVLGLFSWLMGTVTMTDSNMIFVVFVLLLTLALSFNGEYTIPLWNIVLIVVLFSLGYLPVYILIELLKS